jgi:hypothetical protein
MGFYQKQMLKVQACFIEHPLLLSSGAPSHGHHAGLCKRRGPKKAKKKKRMAEPLFMVWPNGKTKVYKVPLNTK